MELRWVLSHAEAIKGLKKRYFLTRRPFQSKNARLTRLAETWDTPGSNFGGFIDLMFISHKSERWPNFVVLTMDGLSLSPAVAVISKRGTGDYPI